MAVFYPYRVKCNCGQSFEAHLADSVNGGRNPELRHRILDGTFHQVACPGCQRVSTVEKAFAYTDLRRQTFFAVKPRNERHQWRSIEASLERDMTHVPEGVSPSEQRHVRVVFGLNELREKLVAQDAGIDDRVVELLKVFLVHEHPFLLRQPRLRLSLTKLREDGLEFREGHEHSRRTYRLVIPSEVAHGVLEREEELKAWVGKSHRHQPIFGEKTAQWVNLWRWSPQPSALDTLQKFAEACRQGQDVSLDSKEFTDMLRRLPRGTHLSAWAKRDLRDLALYAKGKKRPDVEAQLFEVRFGFDLEDDWARNKDDDDIDTLWQLLKDLPDANVEGNTAIDEILLAEGEGGGWYSPSSYDIAIGSKALKSREGFADVVRHEVGHAVHEMNGNRIDPWLIARFGWRRFGTSAAEIDEWVGLMGGWGGVSQAQRTQVRGYLVSAIGPGNSWKPPAQAPQPPANHPWWGNGFGPRLAVERTGADWYEQSNNWYRFGNRAFFLNYWYRELMVVDVATLDFITQRMPQNYAAMSPLEFLAELYALYHDPNDAMRDNIPVDVRDWLKDNLGAPEVDAPAAKSA